MTYRGISKGYSGGRADLRGTSKDKWFVMNPHDKSCFYVLSDTTWQERSRITLFYPEDNTTAFLLSRWFWTLWWRMTATATDDQLYHPLERSHIHSPLMVLLIPTVSWKTRSGRKTLTTGGCTWIRLIRPCSCLSENTSRLYDHFLLCFFLLPFLAYISWD